MKASWGRWVGWAVALAMFNLGALATGGGHGGMGGGY